MRAQVVFIKSPTLKDTRQSPRIDLEVEVTFESEHNFYTGFTQNLSSGGLFIATTIVRPVGSALHIKFTLPGEGPPIDADAVVRWVREVGEPEDHGMGVQFEGLAAPDRVRVDAFIAQRDTIFFDHD